MSLPAVADALADPIVRRSSTMVLVYWFCLGALTPSEWRRVRVYDVQRAIKSGAKKDGGRRSIEHAMRELVRLGYLERGPRVLQRYTYRLAVVRTSEAA